MSNRCLVKEIMEVISSMAGVKQANCFKRKVKAFFGISTFEGMDEAEQIMKMNLFFKRILEPIPNTTFIRSWLENTGNINEYVMLFSRNWGNDVISTNVFVK